MCVTWVGLGSDYLLPVSFLMPPKKYAPHAYCYQRGP